MKYPRFAFLAAALFCVFALPVGAQAPNIAGDWDIVMISPMGQHPIKAKLKSEGEKLSGVVKGEVGETAVEGSITEKRVRIAFKVPYEGTDLLITLMGEIDGDTMKGTADYGGLAQGDWSGKHAADVGAADSGTKPASQDRLDLTGAWTFTVVSQAGTYESNFTFKQEGETLSGQYKGGLGEAEVTGTVKGDAVSFSFKVAAQGMEGVMSFTGTADKNSMTGKFKLGDMAEGTFSARRQ